MGSIEAAFERVRSAVQPLLLDHGFSYLDEQAHLEAFGSRYVTFKDERELIRLAWDGKEQWFVLESIPANSATYDYGWTDILLQSYKPDKDGMDVVDEIAEDMRLWLSDYLGGDEPQ